MGKQKTPDRDRPKREAGARAEKRPHRVWADDAADARSSDDPRARTPHDALGQPSGRPFEESGRRSED